MKDLLSLSYVSSINVMCLFFTKTLIKKHQIGIVHGQTEAFCLNKVFFGNENNPIVWM